MAALRLIRADLLWLDEREPALDPTMIETAILRALGLEHVVWPSRADELESFSGVRLREELLISRDLLRQLDPMIRRGDIGGDVADSVIAAYSEAAAALLEIGRYTMASEVAGSIVTLLPFAGHRAIAAGGLRLQALIQLRRLADFFAERYLAAAAALYRPTPAQTLLDAAYHGQVEVPEIAEELLSEGLDLAETEGWTGRDRCASIVSRLSLPPLRGQFDPFADPA